MAKHCLRIRPLPPHSAKHFFGAFARPWDPWDLGALGVVRGCGGGLPAAAPSRDCRPWYLGTSGTLCSGLWPRSVTPTPPSTLSDGPLGMFRWVGWLVACCNSGTNEQAHRPATKNWWRRYSTRPPPSGFIPGGGGTQPASCQQIIAIPGYECNNAHQLYATPGQRAILDFPGTGAVLNPPPYPW